MAKCERCELDMVVMVKSAQDTEFTLVCVCCDSRFQKGNLYDCNHGQLDGLPLDGRQPASGYHRPGTSVPTLRSQPDSDLSDRPDD